MKQESGDTSLTSWNPAVSVLVSPSANCGRSFSQCVPNAHDQPMDGPFSLRAAIPFEFRDALYFYSLVQRDVGSKTTSKLRDI